MEFYPSRDETCIKQCKSSRASWNKIRPSLRRFPQNSKCDKNVENRAKLDLHIYVKEDCHSIFTYFTLLDFSSNQISRKPGKWFNRRNLTTDEKADVVPTYNHFYFVKNRNDSVSTATGLRAGLRTNWGRFPPARVSFPPLPFPLRLHGAMLR